MNDGLTIGAAFRAAVDANPDRVVVQDEETAWTFRELDGITNHAAAELCDRTSTGAPIAIVAEHRAHTAVAMLAAMKIGRIAVVLDAREPPARLAELVGLAGCELLVASHPVVGLDLARIQPASFSSHSAQAPEADVSPDDVAAVYYTSGSTGTPKGVALTHAILNVRTRRRVEFGQFRPGETIGLLGNLAFGYSSSLFISMLGGITGRLLDLSTLGIASIRARLHAEPISFFGGVPMVLRTITEAVLAHGAPIESVRIVGCGGEALQGSDTDALFTAFPNAVLQYSYGSTESSTIAHDTIERGQVREHGPMRVWEVAPSQSVELVDEHGEPVAPGEAGDVVVSGPTVALGYWRDEALTNEWFTHLPDGTRRVRTGDFARFTDDGRFVLEGRRDDQVKVRGQRVDLGIVVRALNELPRIGEAVTTTDDAGHLMAYVVKSGDQRLTTRDLRASLGEKLPGYMVPKDFFILEAIPRTVRGKVDRAQLAAIRAEAAAKRAPYAAPISETEVRVSRMFEEMLGADAVGLDDDFLDLGGDSLGVLELLELISGEFSIDLHDYLALEATVHTAASVRELARAIDRAQDHGTTDEAIVLRPDGTAVLRIGAPKDGGMRLFLVPGAGEGTVRFLPLANRLERCSVFSFHRRGLQTRDRPDRSVEQLATRLVSALRSVQPAGPYLLGGFSFGNTVACEMAQQLRAVGEHVALLVIIDALDLDDRSPTRLGIVRRVRSRVMRFLLGKPSTSRVARARELADQAREMGAAYRPLPYDGHALIIESKHADDGAAPRWSPELTGPVDRLRLDGSHLDMLGPANAAVIAARIDTLIGRVLEGPSSEAAHGGDVGELDDRGLGPIRRG